MAHDPMKVLLAEHDVMTPVREIVAGMDRLWASEERYEEIFRRLIAFFTGYSDGFHHRKEEIELFPALRNHPDFYPPELLGELEEHHQMFRDHIAAMQAALDRRSYEEAQSLLNRYCNELLDHIAVENDELFVMAASLFNDADLERIFFRFQDIDRELGQDVKSGLEASVAAMKAML